VTLETAVALAFAHLLADFVLQTDWIMANKRRFAGIAAHIAIVAGASWLALGLPPSGLLPILGLALVHGGIDAGKLAWADRAARLGTPKRAFAAFTIDQAAHFLTVWLFATLWPGAWAAGLWAAPGLAAELPGIARLPEAMALAAGLIATVWAGGYAVQELMAGLKPPPNAETDSSLPQGGQLIGRLERLMILMLILARQPDGIGLLIAAKSILRFNELARDADRRASEYVIIGTLASFAWAIGTSWATATILAALP